MQTPEEESKTKSKLKTDEAFDPYVEDVFSAGLTVLQVAFSCTGAELKAMRTDSKSLAKSVEQLSYHYSSNLVIILLLML